MDEKIKLQAYELLVYEGKKKYMQAYELLGAKKTHVGQNQDYELLEQLLAYELLELLQILSLLSNESRNKCLIAHPSQVSFKSQSPP